MLTNAFMTEVANLLLWLNIHHSFLNVINDIVQIHHGAITAKILRVIKTAQFTGNYSNEGVSHLAIFISFFDPEGSFLDTSHLGGNQGIGSD